MLKDVKEIEFWKHSGKLSAVKDLLDNLGFPSYHHKMLNIKIKNSGFTVR